MIFMAAGFDPEAEVFWKEAAKLREGGTGCVDEEFILADRACIEEEIPEAEESIDPVKDTCSVSGELVTVGGAIEEVLLEAELANLQGGDTADRSETGGTVCLCFLGRKTLLGKGAGLGEVEVDGGGCVGDAAWVEAGVCRTRGVQSGL
jgi:hypothetical protein